MTRRRARPLAALQVAVSRLRSLLEPDRQARKGSRLVSTAAGYSLVARPGRRRHVDLRVARGRGARGRSAPRSGCVSPSRPATLWTAAPYADCDAPVVLAETSRLEELLVTLEELRARALLDLGRPDEALRGLAELAGQHPYRERMWSLLALAQYQCSRQADALDTLRRLRERLADELGVDPSEEIRHARGGRAAAGPVAGQRRPTAGTGPAPAAHRPLRPGGAAPGPWDGRPRPRERVGAARGRRAATGSLRFLLVAGEPGIGKSRLVADVGDGRRR